MPTVRPEIADLAVPIDDVRPHPRNPRRGDVKRLCESLVEHGQYVPIVVRRATGEILAGNHTWKAAKRLGWETIAVAWADVDEEEALRILAGDNRYGQLGGFDDHELAGILLGRQDYQWQHEPVLYGWKPGAAHRWYGGRARATIFDDQTPLGSLRKAELVAMLEEIRALSAAHRESRPAASRQHPTMKPVRLVARHLSNSTQPGDVVLDPFGGSGTTLIACHHTGRLGRLIEKDARYVDRICRRWQDHTGEAPVLEETGEAWDFGDG